jgi:hypothetical protein
LGGILEITGVSADLFEKIGRTLVGVGALSGSQTDTSCIRSTDASVNRQNQGGVVALLRICRAAASQN